MATNFTSPEVQQTMFDNRRRVHELAIEEAGMKLNPHQRAYGKGYWRLDLTDELIVRCFHEVGLTKPDSPTAGDLLKLAEAMLGEDYVLLDLHWLRNRLVGLRKAGLLKKEN